MKKRLSKVLMVLSMTMILFGISACGNKPSAETFSSETESEESTIETEGEEETAENESSESEETAPLQTASGHQHNIDVEEKMEETDTEEEVLEEEREEEVQSQTAASEKKESEVQTSTAETTTAEQTTVAAPSTPDMGQLEEWMPTVNMLVVRDANVVDENGNVLGFIAKGSDIGVTGQCPGFYQVNYGAKRSFLPADCLSNR